MSRRHSLPEEHNSTHNRTRLAHALPRAALRSPVNAHAFTRLRRAATFKPQRGFLRLTVALLCLASMLSFVHLSFAGVALRVDESATRMALRGGRSEVSLAVENPAARGFAARVKCELLDTENAVRASGESDVWIRPGGASLRMALSPHLSEENKRSLEKYLWYRLRYSILPLAQSDSPVGPVEGIISLSEITPDFFDLRVSASPYAHSGMLYRARVRAVHPISQQPVARVNVTAEIELEDEDEPLRASGVTGADGYAVIDFRLPRRIASDEADVKFTARLGDFEREAESEIVFDREARIIINTDKPLYQPGQTMHVRALAFDAERRVAAGVPLVMSIYDVEDSLLFRTELVASRFGVVSADWAIPENTRLGDYRIGFEPQGEGLNHSITSKTIKVSRYDLPNFTVNPKADRPYYLPGQDAEVEVRAAYLFGQPVKRGRVKVVRETGRHWSYEKQKWETVEKEVYEGETDETGKFTARINLAKEHQQLSTEREQQFADFNYAAYFTDPTTNRTEQRRFDLRITKHAIHLYLVKDSPYQTNGFPTQFYLSASYADGAPAACEVSMSKERRTSAAWPSSRRIFQFSSAHASPPEGRQRVRTNRFGVAKVSNLMLLGLKDDEDDVSLGFEARDAKGLTGKMSAEFEHLDGPQLRVHTDKPLYRKGEAVRALITGSRPEMTVIVDVVRARRVIRSEIVRLREGRARFTVPYDGHFKGAVSIIAYDDEQAEEGDLKNRAARTVLYPNEENLKLDVRMNRETYLPGEEARAEFEVQTAEGRPVESALGVMVFDRSVEERARTDAEFGVNSSYGFGQAGGSQSVAGFRLEDFERADRTRPLPSELELVAEVLLLNADNHHLRVFRSDEFQSNQLGIFSGLIESQLRPLKHALEVSYNRNREYPTDKESLFRVMSAQGMDFTKLSDPWGMPYRSDFGWSQDEDILDITSAGADKRFETSDDFVALRISHPYFHALGEKFNVAVAGYRQRTKRYIRDAETFKRELKQQGVDFDALRDKRGNPYRIEFRGNYGELLLVVKSSYESGVYDPRGYYVPKEFTVWTVRMDYFSDLRERISSALYRHLLENGRAPSSPAEIFDVLQRYGISEEELKDPWGHLYQIGLESWVQNVERISFQHRAKYGEPLSEQMVRTPVSQQFYYLNVRSNGNDGLSGTSDDFNVANFYRSTYERDYLWPVASPTPDAAQSASAQVLVLRGGNLQGIVFDANRAVVVGASVRATNTETGATAEVTTDEEGFYRFANLTPGVNYTVEAVAAGFSQTIVSGVPVRAWVENGLDVFLEIAGVSSTVEVTAEASSMIQTAQSQLSYGTRQITQLPFNGSTDNLALLTPGVVRPGDLNFTNGVGVSANGNRGRSNNFQVDGQDNNSGNIKQGQISTPRLREYFPETLVWQPLLETDAAGHAVLAFKLADNITTWKMSVIASTLDGEIGIAEREIQAFQPFFVEHDPPRILTEGDQIHLPVVLRNYLAEAQSVRVEIKPEGWFNLLGPGEQEARVAAGDAARTIFGFRAAASIKDGKQRITATGTDASDAIEKVVSVHPDGEEMTRAFSHLLNEEAAFDVNFPNDAVSGSTMAELKIYPNMMAHIIEGIEGIMQRPYGCGEQTISSTYPSLLALKAYKASGTTSPISAKAGRYLRLGYERLLGYRSPGGGFTYWGRGEPNLALSAYALRFLGEAGEFTPVDENILKETRAWLVKQQKADGSWNAYHYATDSEASARGMLTAYIARVLAAGDGDSKESEVALSLKRALEYLQLQSDKLDEPYLIAAYTLAALEAGDSARAARAVERLRALARSEDAMTFWSSETSTPFYGWGMAGRIETTALAVQALSKYESAEPDELASRGLLYLLSCKDQFGVWYSTQATVNVHDALIYAMNRDAASTAHRSEDRAEIHVNGQAATSVLLPPAGKPVAPITVDLSPYLSAGGNRVSIRRAAPRGATNLHVVQSYYLPWNSPQASIANPSEASRALRFSVSYDKTEAQIGAEVSCRVEAARTSGSAGYGMMLAEIGLPPGADVDRASLEAAVKDTGWSLSRYDILPDKLIVYLWPQTGGTRFTFRFRPRYGLTALTAPSVLYDYYNPEARTVLAPTRFTVR